MTNKEATTNKEAIVAALKELPDEHGVAEWYHVRGKAAKVKTGYGWHGTESIEHEMWIMLHLGEIIMDKDRLLSLPVDPKNDAWATPINLGNAPTLPTTRHHVVVDFIWQMDRGRQYYKIPFCSVCKETVTEYTNGAYGHNQG